MYRWIKSKTKTLLGVLVGILISLIITRILLNLNAVQTASWFYAVFDAGLMITFATLYSVYKISNKFPDTNPLLPLFGGVVWVLFLLAYYVLRYNDAYQTALSIIVAGSIAGMGWWIQ
ncbi:hypothetical protein AB4P42_29015, partial [Escherichia coli]